jgi:hypothetical protein
MPGAGNVSAVEGIGSAVREGSGCSGCRACRACSECSGCSEYCAVSIISIIRVISIRFHALSRLLCAINIGFIHYKYRL